MKPRSAKGNNIKVCRHCDKSTRLKPIRLAKELICIKCWNAKTNEKLGMVRCYRCGVFRLKCDLDDNGLCVKCHELSKRLKAKYDSRTEEQKAAAREYSFRYYHENRERILQQMKDNRKKRHVFVR